MQNTNPKSELPAIKEKAAKDKDKEGRQKSIDKERKARTDRYAPIADNGVVEGGTRTRR